MPTPFPGPIQGVSQITSHHQLVHGGGDHDAPALELFCGANPHFRPEQILFEEAIGVLVVEKTVGGSSPPPLREAKATLSPTGTNSRADRVGFLLPLRAARDTH
jgi:hypothetical protein